MSRTDDLDRELEDLSRQLLALADRAQKMIQYASDRSERSERLPPGKMLARARNRANMTQAGLAEASGVAVNTIINFENGRTKPRHRTLMALAEVVGIPWETLMEVEDDQAQS